MERGSPEMGPFKFGQVWKGKGREGKGRGSIALKPGTLKRPSTRPRGSLLPRVMSKVSVQHDKQEEATSHWNGAKWPISTTRSGHEEHEASMQQRVHRRHATRSASCG